MAPLCCAVLILFEAISYVVFSADAQGKSAPFHEIDGFYSKCLLATGFASCDVHVTCKIIPGNSATAFCSDRLRLFLPAVPRPSPILPMPLLAAEKGPAQT